MPTPLSTSKPTDPTKFVEDAMDVLRKRYPGAALSFHEGAKRTHYDATFVGAFRGIERKWNVEIWPCDSHAPLDRLHEVYSRYQPGGPGLICIGRGDIGKPNRHDHPELKGEVYWISLEALEHELMSDALDSMYPGEVIGIGHNSGAKTAAIEAMDKVARLIETSNSVEVPPEERRRLAAELRAAKALLAATTVRLANLKTVVFPALRKAGELGFGTIVRLAAVWAVKKLFELLTENHHL
ncbi:MAG TPA: hypothetical protein VGG99_27495 [Acetobacteraceae bacterium]|jgi:hypothetical protein